MIDEMLSRYTIVTEDDRRNAVREVLQEVALAGLYRGGFFSKAAFYGGNCLRIFYGLPRFSEDLDFSLLATDDEFSFAPYFEVMRREFAAIGVEVRIRETTKTQETAIASAFLKTTTHLAEISTDKRQQLRIKLEADSRPPLGFLTEEKLLMQPFSFYVKCFQLPDLFAGKMHALLFRQWANRVKGRDWYDFEWYVRKGVKIRLSHFNERALQSGDLKTPLDELAFRQALHDRIDAVDFENAKLDIQRFISELDVLVLWSADYFHDVAQRIEIL